MKHLKYFAMMLLAILMVSCRREHEVIHARVPVDTLAHNDIEKVQDLSTDAFLMDEPLIDVPDIPQEDDFERVTSRDLKEFDDYMKGL